VDLTPIPVRPEVGRIRQVVLAAEPAPQEGPAATGMATDMVAVVSATSEGASVHVAGVWVDLDDVWADGDDMAGGVWVYARARIGARLVDVFACQVDAYAGAGFVREVCASASVAVSLAHAVCGLPLPEVMRNSSHIP